jgi:hypothetical protein
MFVSLGLTRFHNFASVVAMGMEISLFAVPEDWPLLQSILAGKQNGDLIQNAWHLCNDLRDGESGEEWLAEFSAYSSTTEHETAAMRSTFEMIQDKPHLLAVHFYGASRGHDYWAWLLELAADDNAEASLASSAVFGSQKIVGATATQGVPMMWSSASQVTEIHTFVNAADNRKKIDERFTDFPEGHTFYRNRTKEQLPMLLHELGSIREFYQRASSHGLAAISILD